jgi:capsular polysaccharide biosynthesis protein
MPRLRTGTSLPAFAAAGKRRAHRALQRLAPAGPRPRRVVETFEQVAGVELVDVDLPRDPAPPPTSRTLQAALHPMFTRSYSQPAYPLRVVTLEHARLATGSGVVFTAADELVMETLWDHDHFVREFARPKRLPKPVRVSGTHASIMSLWCENYFHWMFNALPRLAVLEASGVPYDRLIVPAKLKRFQRESLAALGIPESRLMPFTGEHLQPEKLIWIAPLAPINEPSSYLLDWVRRSLGPGQSEPTRMFYVSRKGGTRNAANERELLDALKPLGLERLLPEELSFAEQLSTFASAKLLVGPHGSNFVNAIFSRRLSVLEFFQPAHVNWGVYTMLCAAGHDHWNVMCEPERRLGPRKFDDMHVPVEVVLESVARMLEQPALPTAVRP